MLVGVVVLGGVTEINKLWRGSLAMASERRLVSLKLQSGDTFDNVPVENTESTLAEFLDQTLKTLEV